MVKLVLMLHKYMSSRNPCFLGVYPRAKVVVNHSYSKSKLLLEAACIMTQLVPSDTIVAQFPTTFKRIAVPAVVLSIGTTLLDADTSDCACIFLKVNDRPVHDEAAGSVTVQVDPDLLLIYQMSPLETVKSAVLVTGAATPM